jgi:NhaP-type Na+/H+ or K+/H+ antiporter
MNSYQLRQIRQLVGLVLIAVIGLSAALLFGWNGLEHSPLYMLIASGLLCIGLYFAVCGIDHAEAKQHWRIITIAITTGVLLKYLIIAGSMFVLTRDWRYVVLAMAVTQIDPLSVAALSGGGRLKPHTKTVLNAWAATDDPMTTILTPVALIAAAYLSGGRVNAHTSWSTLVIDLLPFGLALILAGGIMWQRYKKWTAPKLLRDVHNRQNTKNVAVGLSVALGAPTKLFSLPALVGWFYRPQWTENERLVNRILAITLGGATFLLGILLADNRNFGGGALLGLVTFCSQAVAAYCVLGLAGKFDGKPSMFSRRDKLHLALGQQNGITAILLSLVLESTTQNAVATIGLAIVTINVLHFVCNWAFDRYVSPRLSQE